MEGNGDIGGSIGRVLRLVLAVRGHDIPVDPGFIPALASCMTHCSGDSHRKETVEQYFSHLSRLLTPQVWGEALKVELIRQIADSRHSTPRLVDLGPALDVMTDQELIDHLLRECRSEDITLLHLSLIHI